MHPEISVCDRVCGWQSQLGLTARRFFARNENAFVRGHLHVVDRVPGDVSQLTVGLGNRLRRPKEMDRDFPVRHFGGEDALEFCWCG